MLNRAILVGRISTDLELKYTNNNKSYCRFNLAVNRINEGTDFITIVVWNKQADNLVQYQNKGSLILVEGAISVNNYQDQNGNNKTSFEIMAHNVQFLGNKSKTTDSSDMNDNDPYEEMSEEIDLDDILD